MTEPTTKKTALYDEHVKAGGKMVAFAGFSMPVQYRGIIEEHHTVRKAVGLFDVSHMGEFRIEGPGAMAFLQHLTINDVAKLQIGQAQYSAFCQADGGIIDDLIIYHFADHYLMVVNAANLVKDWQWLQQHRRPDVELQDLSDATGLIAIQGRHAQATLQKLVALDLSSIKYYWFAETTIADTTVMIARTGYTGEDGFEVACPEQSTPAIWRALLAAGEEFGIEPIGLGARDTLRLEVKYCLHGNDIDASTNPIAAGLGWITKLDKGDFIGKEAIAKVKAAGAAHKLIGFEVQGRQIARNGFALVKDGQQIGKVTSGTFSPTLQKSIGLGYVATEHSAAGTEIAVNIRDREIPARIVPTPFYKRDY